LFETPRTSVRNAHQSLWSLNRATGRYGERVSTDPAISVVVPTYNRAHALPRVLDALLGDPAAHEVIVAIDGSRDGSLELVQRLSEDDPRLRAVWIENSGEMAAREAGARAATGEIVLFIDDDVLAEPGLVSGHARRHAERDADIVVGYMPVALAPRRSPDDFATRIYAREYEGRCEIYEHDRESVLGALWAGNFSMRRDTCLAVGMPNPGFTARYHPDRDFGMRCRAAGLTGLFDRSLRAQHLHARSLDAFMRDARSQGVARVLLARQHRDVALSDREFERDLPRPAARLIHLARRPRAHGPLARSLAMLVQTAGWVRAWPAQDAAARLLRRLEQQRGAIEQSREAAA
jgi:glycosyltransferase involved in cell wall biosynthesis